MVLGLAGAVMGFFGIVLGGLLADKLRIHTSKGKLYVWLGGVAVAILSAILFLNADHLNLAYAGISILYMSIAMAHGPAMSTINDLVLPRGRATTSAFALMVATFIGIALGPYITGYISDVISAAGVSEGEALRQAMLWTLLLPISGMLVVTQALRHVERDEAGVMDRARALGENI